LLLSEKEMGMLAVAEKIPSRVPTEKQSILLMEILSRLAAEGIMPD
jgi:hypothetical protein